MLYLTGNVFEIASVIKFMQTKSLLRIVNRRSGILVIVVQLLALQAYGNSNRVDWNKMNEFLAEGGITLAGADYIRSLPPDALDDLISELDFCSLSKGRNQMVLNLALIKIHQLEGGGMVYERDATFERLAQFARECLDEGSASTIGYGLYLMNEMSHFNHPVVLDLLSDYSKSDDPYVRRDAEEGLGLYQRRMLQENRRRTGRVDGNSPPRNGSGVGGSSDVMAGKIPEEKLVDRSFAWAVLLWGGMVAIVVGIWISGREYFCRK